MRTHPLALDGRAHTLGPNSLYTQIKNRLVPGSYTQIASGRFVRQVNGYVVSLTIVEKRMLIAVHGPEHTAWQLTTEKIEKAIEVFSSTIKAFLKEDLPDLSAFKQIRATAELEKQA